MDEKFIQAKTYPPEGVDIVMGHQSKNLTKDILDRFIETFDRDGKLTFVQAGYIEKEEAHNTGTPHLASHIWIYNDRGEVLIQQRSSNKDSYPDLWDISAAGHVDNGESLLEAGLREMNEEIGLNISPNDLKLIGLYREEIEMPMHGKPWHNNELNGVFILKHTGTTEAFTIDPTEVQAVKFIGIDELEADWASEEGRAKYTPKSKEYQSMVISGIQQALNEEKK